MTKKRDLGVLALGLLTFILLFKGWYPGGEPMTIGEIIQWVLKMILATTIIGVVVAWVIKVSAKTDDMVIKELRKMLGKKGRRRKK